MKRISILIAVLLLICSCFPDDRNNFMVPDSFGITSLDNVVEASVHTGSYVLGIAKSGKGLSAASVRINWDASEYNIVLGVFNREHGTDYKALPASLVAIDQTEFSFTKEDVAKEATLSWDPEQVAAALEESDDYVIPILIESDDAQVKVSEGRNFMLIHLNRSSVALKQSSMVRNIEEKNANQQETVTLDVEIDNPIKGMGISYPIYLDKGSAPEGLVTLLSDKVSIPESGKSGKFQIELDYSVLLKNGTLPEFPSYEIVVSLGTEAMTATFNGEAFPLEGLAYGNKELLITINWKETKKGFNVTREWGRFSSGSEAWSDYISGFTANTDRNVTLDGDFIYIAETNKTKNLWAISMKDPGNYKKLPVGGVKDEGIFYLCCPRVIPNTNPDINGGKELLVVSNMAEGDPTLYVYANGVDADPTPIAMTTWASRRLGDTFSWWGSFQDGVVFFKDFNSTQGTVTFWLTGKASGTMYLMGRLAAPAVTGAAAYFPFPDNVNSGFISVRGGSSWSVTASKNLKTLEGADNDATVVELGAEWADCSFRYFTLASKRYIACAKQDNSGAGRLIILEGEGTTDWARILADANIVYTAAIQNETEQDGLDETPCERTSGNSGMDLDIFQSGNDVYIAVVKQNVGLSLFHVSNDE